MSGGEEPKTTSLQRLPQTIAQYTLLLWKVFYDTDVQAQGGGLESVLCTEDNILFGPSTVDIERTDVAAIMRSGVLSLSFFLSLAIFLFFFLSLSLLRSWLFYFRFL